MKVAPWYVPKKCLIKQAKKAADRRIKNCIDISKDVKTEDAQFIRENAESLSKYAARHNFKMEFIPGENNNLQMNVKRAKIYISNDPYVPAYTTWHDRGSVQLPQNLSQKGRYALNYIRTQAGDLSKLKTAEEEKMFRTVVTPEIPNRFGLNRTLPI